MMNPIRSNSLRNMDRSLGPPSSVEKAPGPGGPGLGGPGLGHMPKSSDPMRRRPHNYPVGRSKPMMAVHLAIPKMQDGGEVDDELEAADQSRPDAMDLREPDDQLSPQDQQMKEIVVEAMAALRGQHPDPEKALKRFVAAFGEDELHELEQMMSEDKGPDESDMDEDDDFTGAPPTSAPGAPAAGAPIGGTPGGTPGGMQVGGLLHGPGAGQDDQIEAATPAGRKVLLSDGEYVVDAPTVAALGDGSTNAGARRLDQLRKAIRRQAYGHDSQAKQMKAGGRAALLEALNR